MGRPRRKRSTDGVSGSVNSSRGATVDGEAGGGIKNGGKEVKDLCTYLIAQVLCKKSDPSLGHTEQVRDLIN